MTPTESSFPDADNPGDSVVRGEEVLDRVREIARRIAERVRRVTADTDPDVRLGPTDDTAKNPPLPSSPETAE